MPLTIEQYATWLESKDLAWPAPPEVDKPKAKPHLKKLTDIRAVLWNVYGTLVSIPGGELYFKHPKELYMTIALDKTIQEFNMWGSMSRKPGQPSVYLGQLYEQEMDKQKGISTGGEKHPEISVDKIWEALVKKLLQKDYTFDAGFYGALNELSQKIAYFFHANLQGTSCYPGAAKTMRKLSEMGIKQGLMGEGQCFTTVQLIRGLQAQDASIQLDEVLTSALEILSYKVRAKKPSETLFDEAIVALGELKISPAEVLHIGSRIDEDIAPARKAGFKTALFAGDKESLKVQPEQLKDPKLRPDIMITEISQVVEVLK